MAQWRKVFGGLRGCPPPGWGRTAVRPYGLVRMIGQGHKTGLYFVACVCLVLVAAGLRFYDLAGNSVWYDEAVAAGNSGGGLWEVVGNTRGRNSSPVLYPLALWVVQKVDVSAFSIRVLPAAASVLTVGVMLFLLPRLGVARWAAFLAALLATLSAAAIYHAQDAREYSIDALLATLMIAGLLWYLRDGRKGLLCVSLLIAPLLQYGLVLFGVAVMGVAVLLTPVAFAAGEGSFIHRPGVGRVGDWLKGRIVLGWPAACFLAGCVISYGVTLSYQWRGGGWHGWDYYYYQGAYNVADVLGFAVSRTWGLLNYHLPQAVAIVAVGALVIMLLASLKGNGKGNGKGRRFDAVAVLGLLAVGVAVFAALLVLYPLGGTRQNIYLGPVVFLAAGVAIYWVADGLAGLTGRGWVAPVLVVAAVGGVVLAGVGDIRQENPYQKGHNAKAVLAFLGENLEDGDVVFVTHYAVPAIKFYQDEKPDGYHYGKVSCWDGLEPCLSEMAGLVVLLPDIPNRIFLAHERELTGEGLELLGEQVEIERVLDGRKFGLSVIRNVKESAEGSVRSVRAALVAEYEAVVSGEPVIRSGFDVYLSENGLVYVREPCVLADTEAKFFLHLWAVDGNDLPVHRQQYGFDNLDFNFGERGRVFDGRCMAAVVLPEYDIARVRTGQFVRVGGGFRHLWEGGVVFGGGE